MKIVVVASLVTFAIAVNIPPNFHKCNRKEATFKKCLLEAAKDGIHQLTRPYPALNIPDINPLEIAEASLDGGNGPVSVSQKFTNCKFYGFNQMQLEKFDFDFDQKTLEVAGTIPEVVKKCDYQVKGQVLVVPVNGVGNSTITLKNLKVTSSLKYEERKRKGKTYIKFVSNDLTMDPELVTYDFLNHQDRRLSDNINPVLNENWKQIFDDVKSGYIEIVNKIVLSLLNGFFSRVSLEEALD